MTRELKFLTLIYTCYLLITTFVLVFSESFVQTLGQLISKFVSNPEIPMYLQHLVADQLSSVSTGGAIAFLIIVSGIFWAFIYLRHASHSFVLCSLVLLFFPVANLFMEVIWVRRFSFSVIVLPLISPIWTVLVRAVVELDGGRSFSRVAKSLVSIFVAILVIPGFYLPPFYDGISGWYLEEDALNDYSATGTKILFKDGTEVWFRPSFYSPITMDGRAYSIIKRRDPEFHASQDFSCMLVKLYAKAFPNLLLQRMPWQSQLGHFGYPSHTVDKFDPDVDYQSPADIVGFRTISVVAPKGALGKETEIATWSIRAEECLSSV